MKHSKCSLVLLGLLALLVMPCATAVFAVSAPTLTTLHDFGATNADSQNADGAGPWAGLTVGSDGNFYGTTILGGAVGVGTVFKITPAGTLSTLYSFTGTSDGATPYADLVRGADGNFYGTTCYGGLYGKGTVFMVTPLGALTTLYSFPGITIGGANGVNPWAGLVLGGDGNVYGTTCYGGANNTGTIFKITPSGTLTTLYSFTAYGQGVNADGSNPMADLAIGSDGDFYGTASMCGAYGQGTIFKIAPSGTFTTLHSFSLPSGSENSDGVRPYAGLIKGSDGSFYGTAQLGGDLGYGTIFKITSGGTLTPLYSFLDDPDGAEPFSGLIQASDDNLYGAAQFGGAYSRGVLFRITTSGAFTTLHSFNWTDGDQPRGRLVIGGDGSFYGTTSSGGANGSGTVFKLTVPGVGPVAGSTYALWNHSGQAALWKIPVTGSVTSASFGPFTGWTPSATASDTSGNAYILWNYSNGAASVWKVSSSLKLTTSQSFGPYTGWTAKALAVGPDGNVHLLWNHTSDNAASIFNIVLGTSSTSKSYGPFTGWQATQIAVDSNNNTRVLWSNSSLYEAALWNITSAGVQTSQTLGPYSGWQAQCLAVGPDNLARIVWNYTSTKQASLFTVASDGSVTSKALGPYAGWTPAGLAVNNDGDSELMWNNASNQLSLFDIPSTGSFTSAAYGPFSGWKAIAIAPGP